jgi:nucleoside-diphosphate-sugar epimerase
MRVLVTGATGFIGSALVDRLVGDRRFTVRALVRAKAADLPASVERVVGDLDADRNWHDDLAGVDAIVHLAARVHVMRDEAADPLAEYRRVNVAGTLNLARHAARTGVRRFIALSSVKVNGESGTYSESAPPAPQDHYGISKLEAEVGLRAIATDTSMEVVVIRAPLVYGPGVRANFEMLIRAVACGVPLPLGAANNRRSFVGVDNLVDFIVRCMTHPAAADETFFVSDGEDLSTADLIRRLARAMGRPARLIPVSPPVLRAAAALAGRRDMARRLLGSLCVDITKARQRLEWEPPVSVDEGLRRAITSTR